MGNVEPPYAECRLYLVASEILNSSTGTAAPSLPPPCGLCPRCRVNTLLICSEFSARRKDCISEDLVEILAKKGCLQEEQPTADILQ